jgi:large subunit ribosomal protein L5
LALAEQVEAVQENPMRRIKVAKVVVNVGVGRSGEVLERVAGALEKLVGQRPKYTQAKRTIRDFGIRKREPIGLVVTLRGERAIAFLKRALQAKGNRIPATSFDNGGNLSFGIREHIDIPGVKYDPQVGIFGMDVTVVLERPGYRVARRKRARSRVGKGHRVSREEAIAFFQEELGVEVV